MIDRGVPPGASDWPQGTLEALAAWEQGDVVAKPPFFYFGDPDAPVWQGTKWLAEQGADEPDVVTLVEEDAPPFGMVTSQTCDIVEEDAARPMKPWVQIAPVYSCSEWKKKLIKGRGPAYLLSLPQLRADPGKGVWVVDLRLEFPVEKGWLAKQPRLECFPDEESKRAVGQRVAMLRSRPAFSPSMSSVHRALTRAIESWPDDEDIDDLAPLDEVAVHIDNHLRPTVAQLVFLTAGGTLDERVREKLEEWWESLRPDAAAAGLNLLTLDFRNVESVSLADYRRMTALWSR